MPTRKIAPYVGYTVTTQGTASYELVDAMLLKNATGNAGLHSRLLRDVYSDGTTGICYAIYNEDDYEIGLGTLDTTPTPNTLSRDTILESSNTDTAVFWGAGTRVLVVTPYPPDISLLSNNLEGLSSAATARSNLGSTTVGDALFTAASEAAGRTAIGITLATAATADTVALRDGAGQIKAADPTANDDVATKGWSESNLAPSGTLTAPTGTGIVLTAGAVPTGWTRQNATERLALQLAQSGETIGTLVGSWTTGSHVLTLSQIPSHQHNVQYDTDFVETGVQDAGVVNNIGVGNPTTVQTNAAGGGGGHTHSSDVKAQRVAEITKD